MSTPKDDGGPAFPWRWMDRDSTGQEVTREQGEGMTLRDWFAGMALQGMLATDIMSEANEAGEGSIFAKVVSKASYQIADAMLAARKEEK